MLSGPRQQEEEVASVAQLEQSGLLLEASRTHSDPLVRAAALLRLGMPAQGLALASGQRGRGEELARRCEATLSARQVPERPPAGALAEAERLLAEGSAEEAKQLCQRVLWGNASDVGARASLARALAAQGCVREAVSQWEQLAQRTGCNWYYDDAAALLQKGESRLMHLKAAGLQVELRAPQPTSYLRSSEEVDESCMVANARHSPTTVPLAGHEHLCSSTLRGEMRTLLLVMKRLGNPLPPELVGMVMQRLASHPTAPDALLEKVARSRSPTAWAEYSRSAADRLPSRVRCFNEAVWEFCAWRREPTPMDSMTARMLQGLALECLEDREPLFGECYHILALIMLQAQPADLQLPEQLWRRLLHVEPRHPFVRHCLGQVVSTRLGPEAALPLWREQVHLFDSESHGCLALHDPVQECAHHLARHVSERGGAWELGLCTHVAGRMLQTEDPAMQDQALWISRAERMCFPGVPELPPMKM